MAEKVKGERIATEGGINHFLTLILQGVDHPKIIKVKVRPTTRMFRIMVKYGEHVGIPYYNLRFAFDCHQLNGGRTVSQSNLRDGDTIDVYKAMVFT